MLQRDPPAGGAGDEPQRSTPWVNFAGGRWPDQFYAGAGPNAGIDVARVELRFANRFSLEDDTKPTSHAHHGAHSTKGCATASPHHDRAEPGQLAPRRTIAFIPRARAVPAWDGLLAIAPGHASVRSVNARAAAAAIGGLGHSPASAGADG